MIHVTCLLVLMILPLSAAAVDIPALSSYQGYLKDGVGNSITGTRDITVSIFPVDDPLADPVWTETHESVGIYEGVFELVLGTITEFPPALTEEADRWIGVSIDGGPYLIPLSRLTASMFALASGESSTAEYALQATGLVPGVAVTSLNDQTDDMSIVGGAGVSVETSSNQITVTADPTPASTGYQSGTVVLTYMDQLVVSATGVAPSAGTFIVTATMGVWGSAENPDWMRAMFYGISTNPDVLYASDTYPFGSLDYMGTTLTIHKTLTVDSPGETTFYLLARLDNPESSYSVSKGRLSVVFVDSGPD